MREDEFYQWLGQFIKGLRREKNITQREICLRFRLSRSSLSNIESGRHRLSTYALYELLSIIDEPFEQALQSIRTRTMEKKQL